MSGSSAFHRVVGEAGEGGLDGSHKARDHADNYYTRLILAGCVQREAHLVEFVSRLVCGSLLWV